MPKKGVEIRREPEAISNHLKLWLPIWASQIAGEITMQFFKILRMRQLSVLVLMAVSMGLATFALASGRNVPHFLAAKELSLAIFGKTKTPHLFIKNGNQFVSEYTTDRIFAEIIRPEYAGYKATVREAWKTGAEHSGVKVEGENAEGKPAFFGMAVRGRSAGGQILLIHLLQSVWLSKEVGYTTETPLKKESLGPIYASGLARCKAKLLALGISHLSDHSGNTMTLDEWHKQYLAWSKLP